MEYEKEEKAIETVHITSQLKCCSTLKQNTNIKRNKTISWIRHQVCDIFKSSQDLCVGRFFLSFGFASDMIFCGVVVSMVACCQKASLFVRFL